MIRMLGMPTKACCYIYAFAIFKLGSVLGRRALVTIQYDVLQYSNAKPIEKQCLRDDGVGFT